MKHLKIFGCVAVPALIATMFLGTGSASATVLCKGTTVDCGGTASALGNGSTLHMNLTVHTRMTTTGSNTIATCTTATKALVVKGEGSTSSTVWGEDEADTFGGCTTVGGGATTVKAIALGTWEIHHIAGTDNGTVTSSGTEITVVYFGADCIYATNNTTFGTLIGGNPAKLSINATLEETTGAFGCVTSANITGTYELTSPTGTLHVVAG